jgi:hypothetical protein
MRSGLDIDGATWTIPWTFEELAYTGPESRVHP